jgi:Mn-dependent DtxR family transcriptional regulator
MAMVAQTAACNSLHSMDERICRWILITNDRVQCDEFPLTQEFLAIMLGVRRATVSMEAKRLQQAGLVDYRRAG